MKYRIENETKHRIRIRLYTGPITSFQEEILQYAFSSIQGVRKVTVYRATGGCALEHDGSRERILEKLNAFHYENVTVFAKEEQEQISLQEVRDRKLSPELKRRLRMRVLLETVADLVMPVPLQVGYHAYQMITLKDI